MKVHTAKATCLGAQASRPRLRAAWERGRPARICVLPGSAGVPPASACCLGARASRPRLRARWLA